MSDNSPTVSGTRKARACQKPVKTVGNVRSSVLEESNVPNVEGSKYNAFIDNITEPKKGFSIKM